MADAILLLLPRHGVGFILDQAFIDAYKEGGDPNSSYNQVFRPKRRAAPPSTRTSRNALGVRTYAERKRDRGEEL